MDHCVRVAESSGNSPKSLSDKRIHKPAKATYVKVTRRIVPIMGGLMIVSGSVFERFKNTGIKLKERDVIANPRL
jgi:hypothetical protein